MVRNLPLGKFYDVPDPLPAGKPGDLIRSEPFEEYDLPPGISAVRILYHSRSATGEDVAATGVVLFPEDEKPPTGGWPVISWAHGFSGVARQCAPSLQRNVGHGPLLSMYVNLGYAVVGTDYTGLGTRFRNASSDEISNATDVIYSVPAAHAAVPQLGSRWIAVGEAEGGQAAVAVSELENEIRDTGYLGSVAVTGLSDMNDFYEKLATGSSRSRFLFLAYGIKTVYPQFEVKDVLTQKGLQLYQQIDQSCADPGIAKELSAADIVKPGWQSNKFVEDYFRRNKLGEKRAFRPLLILSGESDLGIPIATTAQIVARMCKQKDQIQFQRYPELDSARVMGESASEQITWIHARFTGGPVSSNCR
jgi:Secretory lipase